MPRNQIQTPNFRSNRQMLIAAAKQRNTKGNNIWYVYSTKMQKDFALFSDAEYLNFVWLEGDPEVVSFEIESALFFADKDDSHGASRPDAIVTYKDPEARLQWREVKSVEDSSLSDLRQIRQKNIQSRITQELNYDYLRVTPALLKQHWVFITNWRRATAFLSAAKKLELTRYADLAHAHIDQKEKILLKEFKADYSFEEHPLALAGLLHCAQTGRIHTDLHKYPIGPETVLEKFA